MDLSQFDFLRRAVEALAVGASLALQAAALASIAELNCEMKFSPRTAAVSAVDAVQDAANGVLTKLLDALPPPSDSSASTPLRRCLNDRLQETACLVFVWAPTLIAVLGWQLLCNTWSASTSATVHCLSAREDARDRLPQARGVSVPFCYGVLSLAVFTRSRRRRRWYSVPGRLFNATAREVLSAVSLAQCPETGLAFVGPFASYATRTGTATSAFTSGDQARRLVLGRPENLNPDT
ncbi:unnamed protein product [Symbiodinium natans]|uniref:Uncharacterized protein n=1 Tax=Symbiodinium natans TaxID=878477 RepID=A0A812JZ34_9DINO|nr:unnamed protein product [Symbiodinium natans]